MADSDVTPFFEATGAVCSLKPLAEAAGQSGFLNAAPDSDGILRRAPLVIGLDGRVYPSLAVAAVSMATAARDGALRAVSVNHVSLTLDQLTVPLDGKSNLLLRYRGQKGTFPHVSAADVIGGRVPVESIKNKIVFVGTTAVGTREVVATPLDTSFVGVEVQATVADNLLQRDFVHRPVEPQDDREPCRTWRRCRGHVAGRNRRALGWRRRSVDRAGCAVDWHGVAAVDKRRVLVATLFHGRRRTGIRVDDCGKGRRRAPARRDGNPEDRARPARWLEAIAGLEEVSCPRTAHGFSSVPPRSAVNTNSKQCSVRGIGGCEPSLMRGQRLAAANLYLAARPRSRGETSDEATLVATRSSSARSRGKSTSSNSIADCGGNRPRVGSFSKCSSIPGSVNAKILRRVPDVCSR